MHFVEKEPIQKRKDFTDKLKSKKILKKIKKLVFFKCTLLKKK